MASLSLRHIYKVYEGKTKAVNDFCMEIRDREFIVFVGPSGCGKSTTLRMIAGLEDISAGELRIDGEIVNDVEPGERNIAMVFQNYALYPHMTVYENMAFSLRTARVPKEEIHRKVMEAAQILGITEYLERKPRALSGGQRQRVALGRAIVRSPKVFLLDEPLSNLDAKLRAAMRAEITRLYERLGTTFIYVTHDQVEAMTMGTRIVVMRGGRVQQIDTPKNLYSHPANLFVAGFIGTPRMNFWPATLKKEGNTVRVTLQSGDGFSVDYACLHRVQTRYMDGAHPVIVGVRPDDVTPWQEGMDPTRQARLPVIVTTVEALGGETLVYGRLGQESPGDGVNDSVADGETDASPRAVIIKAPATFEAKRGDVLDVAVRLHALHLFDGESEVSIKPRIPTENVCPCSVEGGALSFAGQRFPLPPALRTRGGKAPVGAAPDGTTPTADTLILPAEAIRMGTGAGRAKVEEVEIHPSEGVPPSVTIHRDGRDGRDGREAPEATVTLYRLSVGGATFFALEAGQPRFSAGDSLPFDVDFSRITVEAKGILPPKTDNEVAGLFLKEKVVDDRPHSPTRGRKIYRFTLELCDQPVEAEEALCQKLFSCKGTAIFHTHLTYRFPAEAVTVTPKGKAAATALAGRVTECLDYGLSTYARVRVGRDELITPYGGTVGEEVAVTIDQSRLTVVDRDADIVIV